MARIVFYSTYVNGGVSITCRDGQVAHCPVQRTFMLSHFNFTLQGDMAMGQFIFPHEDSGLLSTRADMLIRLGTHVALSLVMPYIDANTRA